MKSICRSQAEANLQLRSCLPVTPDILQAIHSQLPAHSPDSLMLCCLGFFGLLRAGEFTVPSLAEFDPNIHLTVADVALDSHSCPSIIWVRLKQSQTDPFRMGVDIYMGKMPHCIHCPITAMASFLGHQGPRPLFIFQDGSPPSHQKLVASVRRCLSRADVLEHLNSGHSIQFGAATLAAKVGLDDSLIQTLGHW